MEEHGAELGRLQRIETALAKESTLLAIKGDTSKLDVALSTRLNTLGQKATAASAPVVLSSEQEAKIDLLAKDGTDGTAPPAVLGAGTGIRGWLRSIYEKLTGSIAVTGTFWQATQPVSAASLPLPNGAATAANQQTNALTDVQLRAGDVKTRNRSEASARLLHAHGTVSVPGASWATLASITVATGKKFRLLMAEGDYSDLGAIGNNRGIRVRQGVDVRATALTGANQPNPDIEGLTLENTSGANETWDIQGRNGDAVNANVMYGWFTWVEVSD